MQQQDTLLTKSWQRNGLASIRILAGLLMAYHGLEVFDSAKMEDYAKWDVMRKMPAPLVLVYIGKILELVTGVCFVFGLFTRVAALLMAGNMLFICFKVGNGRFYYEDQHPFLFAMVALIFFFSGPVKWSLDQARIKKEQSLQGNR